MSRICPSKSVMLGMVFQNYALFPNMSVYDNIAYGLKIKRLPPASIRQRVDEVMAMVDLDGFAQRSIDKLSGGQKQRVALARAIAVQPKVLLFDEPLAALDAKLRDRLRLEIGTLLRRLGITAVYVTHDQAEAMALGDRIAVMEQGRIAQIGTPRQIYHQPGSAFVADFIGSVNRIPIARRLPTGQLEVSGGRLECTDTERQQAFVFCRPEDITLVPPGEGHIRGEVMQSFFLGQHQRLLIDTGDDMPLQVDVPSRRVWHRGDPVGLRIEAEALFSPQHRGTPASGSASQEPAHG